jgi:hypothetical protein
MLARLAFVAIALSAAAPAYAGIAVPMPEAGEGLLALGMAGAVYAHLRRRTLRK